MLQVSTQYSAESLTILDVRCGGCDTWRPAEEWNTEFEIVVTRRGVYRRRVGNTSCLASVGTASLWNSNEGYRITHPTAGGDRCSAFRLDAAWARDCLRGVDPALADARTLRAPLMALSLDVDTYLAYCRVLRTIRAGVDALAIEDLTARFVSGVSRAVAARMPVAPRRGTPNRGRHRELAELARETIAVRFTERLTLSDLARTLACSPFHLSHVYRRVMGRALHQDLVRIRLFAALERLLETRGSISQIALEVGFSSHAHFTHAFSREFGMPPSAARTRGTPA